MINHRKKEDHDFHGVLFQRAGMTHLKFNGDWPKGFPQIFPYTNPGIAGRDIGFLARPSYMNGVYPRKCCMEYASFPFLSNEYSTNCHIAIHSRF